MDPDYKQSKNLESLYNLYAPVIEPDTLSYAVYYLRWYHFLNKTAQCDPPVPCGGSHSNSLGKYIHKYVCMVYMS